MMTATPAMINEYESGPLGSALRVTVDCTRGIRQPRWSVVEDEFYDSHDALFHDAVSLGPIFHVKEEALGDKRPFNVFIELTGAVFAEGWLDRVDPIYDRTHEGSRPLAVRRISANQALVSWLGSGFPREESWARWILRLWLSDATGALAPLYLAFTCFMGDSRTKLEKRLMPKVSSSRRASPSRGAKTDDAREMNIRIDLQELREPCFPGLFKPRDEIGLPRFLYLEPLIVIRKGGEDLDLVFTTDDAMLFPCDPSPCNPSSRGREPLALVWLGVTHPKECDEDELVARGFETSWIDDDGRSAGVRLRQALELDEARPRHAASFFFVQQKVIGGGSPTATLQQSNALVDPTVVYDQDDPPRGG